MKFTVEHLEKLEVELNALESKSNAILCGFYWGTREEIGATEEKMQYYIKREFAHILKSANRITFMGDGEYYVVHSDLMEIVAHSEDGEKIYYKIPLEWFNMSDEDAQWEAKKKVKSDIESFVEKKKKEILANTPARKREKLICDMDAEELLENIKNHPSYEDIAKKINYDVKSNVFDIEDDGGELDDLL